jgi:hypothetical protein
VTFFFGRGSADNSKSAIGELFQIVTAKGTAFCCVLCSVTPIPFAIIFNKTATVTAGLYDFLAKTQ